MKAIEILEKEIRECETGIDDTGEPTYEPTTVFLDLSVAKEIFAMLKKEESR